MSGLELPPGAPKPPTVTEVYVPFFIGAFISTALYGVFVSQALTYLQTCRGPMERCHHIPQVLYLFLAETANTVLDIAIVYEPLLTRFGDPLVVADSPLFLRADPVVTALISTPVQIFMAWRIRVIMQSWIPFMLATALAITSLVGSIWLTISLANSPQFQTFDSFEAAPITWLVTSAAADILISVCLVYGLSKKRPKVSQLNDQIDRIIRFAVQTGAITAVAAFAEAIVLVSFPHTTVPLKPSPPAHSPSRDAEQHAIAYAFFSWDLSLSKLYSNTLLSSINARNKWRERIHLQKMGPNALFDSSEATSHTAGLGSQVGTGSYPLSKLAFNSPKSESTTLQFPTHQTPTQTLSAHPEGPWTSPPSRSRRPQFTVQGESQLIRGPYPDDDVERQNQYGHDTPPRSRKNYHPYAGAGIAESVSESTQSGSKYTYGGPRDE
ncbi:hypothetical protein D9758_017547 [Tetrapyrgos nigripes]|uniref:DUF6534 domain-containing protein n=1 Tax=Tetrapyrgos nigripes TaxID=182062 RepID=A0A8H5C8D9_9AGAR|nr:hypothetical protein D9758_017547 [Tetrapyrgos nigripes]